MTALFPVIRNVTQWVCCIVRFIPSDDINQAGNGGVTTSLVLHTENPGGFVKVRPHTEQGAAEVSINVPITKANKSCRRKHHCFIFSTSFSCFRPMSMNGSNNTTANEPT